MNKNRHIIGELQEFFANNDASKAINSISTIMNSIRIQSKVIGSVKNPNCKFTCLQVLQLLVLFPFFSVKNAANYSSSALSKLFACHKDMFYRFMNDGNVNWRRMVFERSNKGHRDILEKYDLDSDKDFILWGKENGAYHCFDLSYVRVHLLPAPKGSKWRPILSAAHEWAINEMMSAAKALSAAGIPFVIPQAREILKMHEMTGNIIIDSDYCDRSRIGEIVRRLPEAGYDNVTKYQVEELIKIIKWDNLKEVKLCKIKH